MTPTNAQNELPVMPLIMLEGNSVPRLDAMQQWALPHVETIAMFWWFAWFIALMLAVRFVLVHGVRGDRGGRECYSDAL